MQEELASLMIVLHKDIRLVMVQNEFKHDVSSVIQGEYLEVLVKSLMNNY